MTVVFETLPDHRIAYLNLDKVVCIIGNLIVTDAHGWAIQVSDADRDRIKNAFMAAHGEPR